MGTLTVPLHDAGILDKKDATQALLAKPHEVIVAEPIAISSLPPLSIASMPLRMPWRFTITRDANNLLIEITATPIEESIG